MLESSLEEPIDPAYSELLRRRGPECEIPSSERDRGRTTAGALGMVCGPMSAVNLFRLRDHLRAPIT